MYKLPISRLMYGWERMPWSVLEILRKNPDLMKENLKKKVKVIVGGAPVTEEWAKQIGADAYGKDAYDAVRKVKELLNIE